MTPEKITDKSSIFFNTTRSLPVSGSLYAATPTLKDTPNRPLEGQNNTNQAHTPTQQLSKIKKNTPPNLNRKTLGPNDDHPPPPTHPPTYQQQAEHPSATSPSPALTTVDQSMCSLVDKGKVKCLTVDQDTKKPSKSWSNVVKPIIIQDSTFVLRYIEPSIINGRVVVSPPPSVAALGAYLLENIIVGHFLDTKLPFNLVNYLANRLWKHLGLIKINANKDGFYFFHFSNQMEVSNILEKGPWFFVDKYIALKEWKTGMVLNRDEFIRIPLWINLYNVPREYWTAEGISYVASAVGIPLKVDKNTGDHLYRDFARVCVEVNAEKEIIEDFDLINGIGRTITIHVDYKWKPSVCKECKTFSHKSSKCPKLVSPPPHTPNETLKNQPMKGKDNNLEWRIVNHKGKGVVENLPTDDIGDYKATGNSAQEVDRITTLSNADCREPTIQSSSPGNEDPLEPPKPARELIIDEGCESGNDNSSTADSTTQDTSGESSPSSHTPSNNGKKKKNKKERVFQQERSI